MSVVVSRFCYFIETDETFRRSFKMSNTGDSLWVYSDSVVDINYMDTDKNIPGIVRTRPVNILV